MIQKFGSVIRVLRLLSLVRPFGGPGCMNKMLIALLLLVLPLAAAGQKTQGSKNEPLPKRKQVASAEKSKKRPVAATNGEKPDPEPTPVVAEPEADRKLYDAALAAPTTLEKAKLLRAFIDAFPDSNLREEALSYLITARAVVGNELVQAGDPTAGIASYRLAIEEAPLPIPDRMFGDVVMKIPATLFYGKDRAAAMDLALLIEKKVAANPKQMLGVAAFYLGTENGAEAKRVAESVLAVDPTSVAAYQALGLADRLNFDLQEAAEAYAKAIELDPASVSAKRSLAEMYRALGKADAAVAIYRELLEANEADGVARQGLILSLFDSGRQKEAESEFASFIQAEPRNFSLLAGVAYWYAANDQGAKAVEYAQKAVDIEPRYIWGHVVQARGLMKEGKPLDAERVLLKARQYGNFPTLDYEIASARFQAGLYREASEELRKSFSIKNGLIGTRLGGRIFKEENGFIDLIGYERRASLLEPSSAESPEAAAKLKLLMELERAVENSADEAELAALADEFIMGSDGMKLHRQLYVANLFLRKNVALTKATELVKASIGSAESGLDVAAPGAAVMASELYESRTAAFARNEVIVIPEVPRQTLSAILRGRIEELTGWAAFQKRDYPEAVVHLRRSISVLPDKSAWWRSAMWRLGAALEADGKETEALESYIKSYVTDRPSTARYIVIEALYKRVNGNSEGLEEKVGPNPGPIVASATLPEVKAPSSRDPNAIAAKIDSGKPAAALSEIPPAANQTDEKSAAMPTAGNSAPTPVTPVNEPGSKAAVDKPDLSETGAANSVSRPASAVKQGEIPVASQETIDGTKAVPVRGAEVKDPAPGMKDSSVPIKDGATQLEKEKAVADTGIPADDRSATDVAANPGVKTSQDKTQETKESTSDPQTKAEATPNNGSTDKVLVDPNLPAKEVNAAAVDSKAPDPNESKIEAPSVPQPSSAEKKQADSRSDVSPPTNTGLPAEKESPPKSDAEPAKEEPINLLRDPFANSAPTSAKPTEDPGSKPVIIVNDPYKDQAAANKAGVETTKAKQIFEPIVIKAPGEGQISKGNDRSLVSGIDRRPAPQPGVTRTRIVEGKEIISDQQCSLQLSQASIMLLSGGGSLGLQVAIDGPGDISTVTGSSVNPADIEVRPEPLVEGATKRRFFVIKSVSDKTGIFHVNFESPCGKGEVEVHVR